MAIKSRFFLGLFFLLFIISCGAEDKKVLIVQEDHFEGSLLLDEAQKVRINEWVGNPSQTWNLVYRLSEHGASSSEFHARSDGQGQSVVLVKMDNGVLIGGYNSLSWNSDGAYFGNAESFLFSLTNDFKHEHTGDAYYLYGHVNYGPTFGGGHDLYINNTMGTGYCNIGYSYIARVGTYGSAEARNDFCGSYNSWTIQEMEVWVK